MTEHKLTEQQISDAIRFCNQTRAKCAQPKER